MTHLFKSNLATRALKRTVSVARQRGISLLVVMVMLLVSTIAVLGATRFGWLGEAITSNEADYQRTRAAADALLSDAMTDVAGYLPNGALCKTTEPAGGCRLQSTPNNPALPMTWADVDETEALITAQAGYDATYPCLARTDTVPGGLCIPITTPIGGTDAPADWWNTSFMLDAMKLRGTTYGGATGNVADPQDRILSVSNDPSVKPQAWYWLEAFKYQRNPSPPRGVAEPALQAKPGTTVFRITVIALGRKDNTRVVLQSLVVPPMNRL